MRNASVKSGLFDSSANETFTGMFDQQMALKVASGSSALTDAVVRQLSRNLPHAPDATTPSPARGTPASAASDAAATATTPAAASAPETAATPTSPPTPPPPLSRAALAAAAAAAASAARCDWFGDDDADTDADSSGAMPEATRAADLASALGAAPSGGLPSISAWTPAAAAAGGAVVPGAATTGAAGVQAGAGSPATALSAASADPRRAAFVARLGNHARVAQQLTGIPAHFILGQAALETGWGQHEMRASDGSASHNFFGIKAGSDWSGRTVDVATTEFENGVGRRVIQRFRAYGSDAEGFRDWARLIAGNPRYAGVVRHGRTAAGFAQGLQQAGYATDPAYGAKLMHTISSLAPGTRT